jgi:hypothetical protein
MPGQSVTLTLFHTTYPCDRSEFTCLVPVEFYITPNFTLLRNLFELYAPELGPTSPNNISGIGLQQ